MYPKLYYCFLSLMVLTTFACIGFSFGRNQKDPLDNSLHQSYGLHNPRQYSTSISAINRLEDRNEEPEFSSSLKSSSHIFNVDDFGAKGDGTDDTKAFKKAWKHACSSEAGVFLVPENRVYQLKPMNFTGPCKSSQLTMRISGTIKASPNRLDYRKYKWTWIVFVDVENLRVEGSGTIDGNGRVWWENSCKVNKSLPCTPAPFAVTFFECKNLIVTNLNFKNAQKMHLSFHTCFNVKVDNLRVIAPRNSPNTDGIHMLRSENIQLMNCVIETGDDCISIINGTKNVRATDITCGPGHGISIGSLGTNYTEAQVSNVIVDRVQISGTTNGLRIKTWQGGSGYAENIIFQNIVMHNVTNPIIIDQYYCDKKDEACPEQYSAVQINNVVYNNITGTSNSQVAMNFNCSKNFECQGISLQNVNFVREGGYGGVKASCHNVRIGQRGWVSPTCSWQ